MIADDKFRTEALQTGLELDPIPGEDLDRITAKILDTSKEIVDLATDLVK